MRIRRSFRINGGHAMPRIMLQLAGLLLAAVTADVEPAQAQAVAGRVTSLAAGAPLEGVYVYVTTQAGNVAAAGLTDARGMFVLRVPAPGRYDLHAELIGHQPAVAGPLLLSANATERQDLALTVRAIDLAAITVEAGSRCRSGPPAAPVTQALWDEVRTALRINRWTQEKGALGFGLVRTRRKLDPATLNVKSVQSQTTRGYYAGSPYVALPADRLAQHGFVTHTDDGDLEYWAPDADVLLSESFLANHCFSVAAPTAEDPTLVGLAFQPVSGRGVPDIEGVLWVRAETAELVRLDFRYVNLPFATRTRWDEVGGRVEFERLADGMWIVRRWRIRMPVVESRRRPAGVSGGQQLVLAALSELAGEVIALDSADGRPAIAATGATSADSLPEPRPRQSEVAVDSVQTPAAPSVTDTAGQRAVPLEEIRVTARRQDFLAAAGFYDRMERGLGWFVDAEQIDRRMPSRVTDLAYGAPGVQVISQGAFGADIRIFDAQRMRGDCPPSIYIDGLQARAYPRSGPPLTDLVDVASVAALEILRRPSEIPARYRGSQSACGVVLVWLKR